MKFIHCADLHLGSQAQSSLLKPDRIRRDLMLTFKKILDLGRREEIDLLLICGDFIESHQIDRRGLREIREALEVARDFEVIVVCGNHDPFGAASIYQDYFDSVEGLHIIPGGAVQRLDFPNLDCSILAYSFANPYLDESVVPQARDFEDLLPIKIGMVQ